MSNLTLTAQWHDTINQVETSEPIIGGAEGNANLATKQLAESLLWLKSDTQQKIDNLPDPSSNEGFTQELSDTGYCQLPNGMIMQWGKAPRDAAKVDGAVLTVQFALPFPNACLNIQATLTQSTNGALADGNINVVSMNKTQAVFSMQDYSNGYDSQINGFTWLAIGH